MRATYRIWQSAFSVVLVLSLWGVNRLGAARLVPDPALPEELVRQFLASNISQPATLGDLKHTSTRTPLRIELDCDVELILNESFYVVVPSSDAIFAPVSDRLTELKQAQAQLNLVPKDFIASLGGQKSSASLSFLKHTFVRTSVPAQTHARIERTVTAVHTERFFGGKWTLTLQSPALAVEKWQGKPLGTFDNPLSVDTPDFQRQLHAFLETAKKTLDEVEDISNRYIAKADEDRAAIFRALPVGAVLSVKDTNAEGSPLFLEVKTTDQKSGEVGFTVTSSFVSRPARTELLRGIHPDPASALRALLESRRQAEIERTKPTVAVVAIPETSTTPAPISSTPVEISAKKALEGEQSVQLSLNSGMPILQVVRVGKEISLQRIPDQEISSERARFENELAELSAATEKGKIYQGTINNTAYLLGVFSSEENGRVFILQPEIEDADPVKVEAELLDVERDHPALQLNGRRQRSLPDLLAAMELSAKGSDLIVSGRFGTVQFQPSSEKRILASGRIVTTEMAAFLEKLARNSSGLYLYPESRFVPVVSAPNPVQSGAAAFGSALLSIGTLGLGTLPTATLHFPAGAPITKLQRTAPLYSLMLSGQFTALPLTKPKSDYVFVANRSNGVFTPRQQDFVSGLIAHELDTGIYSISVSGVKEAGVFALVQSDGNGTKYYLVQIEP